MGEKAKNYIILFLLIIIVLGTTLFFVNNGKKESKIEELSLNDKTVMELFNSVNDFSYFSDFAGTGQGSFHKSIKMDLSTLSDREKLVMVMNKLTDDIKPDKIETNPEFDISEYKREIFNKEKMFDLGKKILGPDFNISDKTSYDSNCGYSYEYDGTNFSSLIYPGGCGGYVDNTYYDKLIKAEKDDENIYLYDKYYYINNDDSSNLFVYNSYDKQKVIHIVNKQLESNLENNNNFFDYTEYLSNLDESKLEDLNIPKDKLDLIKDLPNKTSTYKHTFKKDVNGNYYWVSSEMVK